MNPEASSPAEKRVETEDVFFWWGGFSCEKIKRASSKELDEIEDMLTQEFSHRYGVDFANVEEMGYLQVSWRDKFTFSEKEKQSVIKILNSIFPSKC